MAFFSNFIINHVCPEATAWRWMLGIQVLPSVIYTVMCFSLPESPRWLIVDAKNEAQGRQVFKAINPTYTDAQIDELVSSVKESAKSETTVSKVKFFTKKLRYPFLFSFLISAFN